MKIRNVLVIPFLLLVLTAVSCGNSKSRNDRTETVDKEVIKAPEFDADSAYQYIQVQADFGPRVPTTQAHKECGEYLAGQLEKFGAKVYNQYADLIAYDGTILKSRNIIGAYKPESKKRILLCAHWDSRPYADNDPDPKNHHTPILGVNDGASGVGVLLEIARQIQKEQPALGIDIVFFDSEDYGIPEFYDGKYKQDTWCLGSQYWARTPHVQNYNARYGILLDMVGGKDATFYYEGYSARTARSEMKKIWKKAHELGYGKYFVKEEGGEWNQITITYPTLPESGNWSDFETQTVDLTPYAGKKIKIGFKYTSTEEAAGPWEIKNISITGLATGINKVETDTEDANAPEYNLTGQRVNDSYKGIVIKNGKKYINR